MTSKQANPRAALNEMVVTRHKSAQFKRQLRNKDRSMKRITQLLKSPTNSRQQSPIKTYRPAKKTSPKKEAKEPKTPEKIHPIVKINRLIMKSPQKTKNIIEQKEYYPNKIKRKNISKKILLKPPNQMTLIGDTNTLNKRKRHIPVKDFKSCKNFICDYALSKTDTGDHPLLPKLNLKEILPMEKNQDMTDEDLMEILTCPSPVWWEDPLDSEYEEDPIDVKKIFAKNTVSSEKVSVKSRITDTPEKIKSSSSDSVILHESDSKNNGKDVCRTENHAIHTDVCDLEYKSKNNNLSANIDINMENYTSQIPVETDKKTIRKNVQIDDLPIPTTKFCKKFLIKRNKLESILGCVKNRILTNKTDNMNVEKRNSIFSYSKNNNLTISASNNSRNAIVAYSSGKEHTVIQAGTECTSKYKLTNTIFTIKPGNEDNSPTAIKYSNINESDSSHSKKNNITKNNETKKNIAIPQNQGAIPINVQNQTCRKAHALCDSAKSEKNAFKIKDYSSFLKNGTINDDSKLYHSSVENITLQGNIDSRTNTSINEANTYSAVTSCLRENNALKGQTMKSNCLRNEKKIAEIAVEKYDENFLMKRKRLENISGLVRNRILAKMSKCNSCDNTKDKNNLSACSKVKIVRNKRKNMFPKAAKISVDPNEDLLNKLVHKCKIIENISCDNIKKVTCTNSIVSIENLYQSNNDNSLPSMIVKNNNLNIDDANSCKDTENQPKKSEELLKGVSPGKKSKEKRNSESADGEDFFCDDEMLMHLENLDIPTEDDNTNKNKSLDFIDDQNLNHCSDANLSKIVSNLRCNHISVKNKDTRINVENLKIRLVEDNKEKCSSPLLKENRILDRHTTNTDVHVPKILPKLQKIPQKNLKIKLASPASLGCLSVSDVGDSSNDASVKDILDTISDTNIRFVMDEEVDNTESLESEYETSKKPKDKIQPPKNAHTYKEEIINCLAPEVSKSLNNEDFMSQKSGRNLQNPSKFLDNKALVETLEEKNPLDDLEYITVYKITANPNKHDKLGDEKLPLRKLKDIEIKSKNNEKKYTDLRYKKGINSKQEIAIDTPLTSTSEITKKRKIVHRKTNRTDNKKAKTSDNTGITSGPSVSAKTLVKIVIHPDNEKNIINKNKKLRKSRNPRMIKGQERIVVSQDTTVKYCLKCSSIFDTDSCTYCCRKQNMVNKFVSPKTNKLSSPFGTCSLNYGDNEHKTNVFVCEICAFCTSNKDLIINHVCQTSSDDLRRNLTKYQNRS